MPEVNITKFVEIGLILVLLASVIGLQFNGYYNRVYYSISECDDIVAVGQTNEMEFNKMRLKIEQINSMPKVTTNENGTMFIPLDVGLEE